MMDCDDAKAAIDAWTAGGGIGAQELEDLREHVFSCGSCANTWGALLALLERDALPSAGAAPVPPAPFVDAVMAGLPFRPILRPAAWPEGRRRTLWIAAAAALVCALAGLGFAARGGEAQTVTVRFVLAAPEAGTVSVAGDFNGWDPAGWTLSRPRAGGPWELEVRLRKGRLYAYNFVVDGERWIPDPAGLETVQDGFGGESSLLKL